jgi:hypothetical protein
MILVGIGLWLRWPALATEGFHNEDVAGIALNADLLLNGLVPLVDNLEYKAPGTFYITALVWSVFGRTLIALQWVGVFWSIMATLGIFAVGRILYGRKAGVVAATIYVLVAPITDSIDVNYGAWMIAPYVWATASFLWAAKTGRMRWILATGILLAFAGLLKRQAAVLFPLFAFAPFIGRYLAWPDEWVGFFKPRRTLVVFGFGLAIGFSPIMAWYLIQGELSTFVGSYFFSESGWKYVQGSTSWSDRIARVGDGLLGFGMYVATPTLLAVMAIAGSVRASSCWTAPGLFLAGHLGLSFVGASLGLRFFKGYYLHVLPALVWIAAHPKGFVTQWLSRDLWFGRWKRLRSTLLVCGSLLLVSPAIIHDVGQVTSIRKRRQAARDPVAKKIGAFIQKNSKTTDQIWVWGRWAWPVYFHADRRAATYFPKSLGVFTSNLTNTWRRPSKNTAFDPRSPWPTLIKQLKRDKPVFLVLSHNERYREFKAFNKLIRDDYRPVRGFRTRGFSVYYRKGHTLTSPPLIRKRKSVKKSVKKFPPKPRRGPSIERMNLKLKKKRTGLKLKKKRTRTGGLRRTPSH